MVKIAIIHHPTDMFGTNLIHPSILGVYPFLQNTGESQFILEVVYILPLHFEQEFSN